MNGQSIYIQFDTYQILHWTHLQKMELKNVKNEDTSNDQSHMQLAAIYISDTPKYK